MANQPRPYPRPPMMLIVTAQEWVSLSVMTLFAPKGYAVLRAFSGAQALERTREGEIDLLVIDRDLRDLMGTALTERLRAEKRISTGTSILMISPGPWQRDEKMRALEAGAWEVCSLPFDGEEVFLKADAWVRAKLTSDITRDEGLLDSATGLYNAQGLLRRIAELGAMAERHRRSLACIVLSHNPVVSSKDSGVVPTEAGTISMLADVLRTTARASDTVARLNDTDFVILAPDTDEEGVLGMAERLRVAMTSTTSGPQQPWSVQFGCYGVRNFHDASIAPTELLVRAAEALRGADRDTRTIRFFDPPLDSLN